MANQIFAKPWIPALGLAVAGAALGLVLRVFVIEVHWIGQLCDAGSGPWWCSARQGLYQAFRIWPIGVGALGLGALAAGLGALWQNSRASAYGACALAGLGVALYNADLAGLGLGLAMIAAVREPVRGA